MFSAIEERPECNCVFMCTQSKKKGLSVTVCMCAQSYKKGLIMCSFIEERVAYMHSVIEERLECNFVFMCTQS